MSNADLRASGDTVSIHDRVRYPDYSPHWFDRDWWQAEGARMHSITGRAGVLMLDRGEETWVFRHYHRGGLVSRLIYDQYIWSGAEQSRPIREWRLLDALSEKSLPSPRPVAARAVRSGPIYRADIITVLLPDTVPLSSLLGDVWDDQNLWTAIGAMLASFHAAGCDHPDLTAHNVLIDSARRPFLVDFDNARLKPPGAWREAGIDRFKRSLNKVSLEIGSRFDGTAWRWLTSAYADHPA